MRQKILQLILENTSIDSPYMKYVELCDLLGIKEGEDELERVVVIYNTIVDLTNEGAVIVNLKEDNIEDSPVVKVYLTTQERLLLVKESKLSSAESYLNQVINRLITEENYEAIPPLLNEFKKITGREFKPTPLD